MAVLGTLNQSKRIIGPAQVYLVARPNTGYTGADDPTRMKAVKALFFSDSATDALRLLIPSLYADIDATGIDIKFKSNPITYDPNLGGKYNLALAPSECTVTFSYKDLDANKIIDAWSALTGDTVVTAPATGVAGRTTIMLGRQSTPLNVAMLIRYPSEITGEFRNIIFPWVNIDPSWELKIDKKNAATVKITATAVCDLTLMGSMPMPPIAFIDDVTASGL